MDFKSLFSKDIKSYGSGFFGWNFQSRHTEKLEIFFHNFVN